MNATNQQAINAYTRADADMAAVASPHKLVLMLFEATVKSVAKARMALQKKQVRAKCDAIDRAIALIQDGLQLSLDTKNGGELAENLNALYEYMCIQLALANAKNDLVKLDEVGRMLLDLKKSWEQIGTGTQPAAAEKTATAENMVQAQQPAAVNVATVAEKVAAGAAPAPSQAAAAAPQPAVRAKPVVESPPAAPQQKNEDSIVSTTATLARVLKGYAMAPEPEYSGSPMNFKA